MWWFVYSSLTVFLCVFVHLLEVSFYGNLSVYVLCVMLKLKIENISKHLHKGYL